jgi:uncharacterized protein YukE
MNSGTVRGLAMSCHRLQAPAQECSDKMRAAIAGLPGYWTDLGGDEFLKHCNDWITKMNTFKQAISDIETDMLNYAKDLQVEEEAAERARQAATRMTGKIK